MTMGAVAMASLAAALAGGLTSCHGPSEPGATSVTIAGPTAPAPPLGGGIWVSASDLAARLESGPAWANLMATAQSRCPVPRLADQDDQGDVCLLSKGLVFARTGGAQYRTDVIAALRALVATGTYRGRALALGRNLPAIVIAADLIDLAHGAPDLEPQFRSFIIGLRQAPTDGGPANLIDCHERRPNNWGTHCGAARVAIAAYLHDGAELDRAAQILRGYLGDVNAYRGFEFGDLAWQCDPLHPVGINPTGCMRDGHSIDGVLPDDQRRSGGFTWPPPHENYVYEALQGVVVQAALLERAGYAPFGWQDRAILRAFRWLNDQALYPAAGDDVWEIHLVNHVYRIGLPAPVPASPGKNMGWTDWTHEP